MYYYKFNIPTWNLSTAHLSLEEEAVYFRLVNFYYDTEQPIPLETQPVIRRLRLGNYAETVALILAEFFIETKKGFVHNHCEEILNEYAKTTGKNRENGKKGGRPRKIKPLDETQKEPSGFSVGTQEEPKHNLNQEPLTINQEPLTINQELETNNQKPVNPWPGLKSLDGIDFSHWPSLPTKETMQQWLAVRKAKKAVNSQIAMDDVRGQIFAASLEGMTADECIRTAVAKSWSGFSFQWIKNQDQGTRQTSKSTTRHNDFDNRDYTAGVTADGTF